ncbi:MAG: hypothetical protein GQF41_1071 [Candidatus Rifleibacterium amylolyticum]|nr:MAG: hypothetical protein GQF41_1071 [Candidatus Rifleibacterium amylolyticum]
MALLFSITSFISAFLIFLVQPMIGKMLLPDVGGAPAVWNTCMFFFQLLVLTGYVYTHLSLKKFGLRVQTFVHLLLAIMTFVVLPFNLDFSETVPSHPSLWILFKLLKNVALPFFLLATLSPLLQVWFSLSGHNDSQNPYFIYTAGNIGSFAALLSYPILIETTLDLSQQSLLWMILYITLLILLLICRLQTRNGINHSSNRPTELSRQPLQGQIIKNWVAAAFIPSSLLLGVTLYLTTDIAPVPLLWVMPLMIYLATFALAFSSYNLPFGLIEKMAVLAIVSFPLTYFIKGTDPLLPGIVLNFSILFAISLYCHSYLAKTRPSINHLTDFYAWISLGGVLGGFFNSLIAPTIFTDFTEYSLIIAAAALFLYSTHKMEKHHKTPETPLRLPVLLISGLIISTSLVTINEIDMPDYFRKLALMYAIDVNVSIWSSILDVLSNFGNYIRAGLLILVTATQLYVLKPEPKRGLFVISGTMMIALFVYNIGKSPAILLQTRNFFGKKEVTSSDKNLSRVMTNGATMHGLQVISYPLRLKPLLYYHPAGPVGDIFALPQTRKPDFKPCIIGLGIGSMAAYSLPGQEFTFIEIDPDVISFMADTDVLFTYTTDYASQCRIIEGDGRLKLKEEPEGKFDIIFIDAFSSVAIPTHLLTLEAIQLYLSRIKSNGMIVFHVSNRYLKIARALKAIACSQNLAMLHISDYDFDATAKENLYRDKCEYVVLAKTEEPLLELQSIAKNRWVLVNASESDIKVWTDQYSSLLPIFIKESVLR